MNRRKRVRNRCALVIFAVSDLDSRAQTDRKVLLLIIKTVARNNPDDGHMCRPVQFANPLFTIFSPFGRRTKT